MREILQLCIHINRHIVIRIYKLKWNCFPSLTNWKTVLSKNFLSSISFNTYTSYNIEIHQLFRLLFKVNNIYIFKWFTYHIIFIIFCAFRHISLQYSLILIFKNNFYPTIRNSQAVFFYFASFLRLLSLSLSLSNTHIYALGSLTKLNNTTYNQRTYIKTINKRIKKKNTKQLKRVVHAFNFVLLSFLICRRVRFA